MQDEIGAVVDLLSDSGFWVGVGVGVLAAASLAVKETSRERSVGWWATAFVLAVGFGIWLRFSPDPIVYLVVGALAFAGLVGDVLVGGPDRSADGIMTTCYWAGALAFVLWLATLLPVEGVEWVTLTLPVVVVVSAIGVWMLGRSDASEILGPMMAISVAGIWVTVPDTDMTTVLLGVAIPLGLATLPPLRAKAHIAGTLALSGTIAWLVLVEGSARPWTIAASWATLATLPVFGVLTQIRPRTHSGYWLVSIHFVYVLVLTRVADTTDSPMTVAVAAFLLAGLAGLTALLVARSYRPAQRYS